MFELTDDQVQSLSTPDGSPPRAVNPHTKETFVLLRVEEYERLKEDEYDDSPMTREERHALNWELAERSGWDDYGDYVPTPEKP